MVNKTPVLYIDLDNVVFNTICIIKRMYDEDFCLYSEYSWIPAHKIKHYDFSDLTFMTRDRLMDYFRSNRFFNNIECMDEAEASIAYLETMGFKIVFVSIGTSENLLGKDEWVSVFNHLWGTHAEFIGVDRIDKSHIDMSDGIIVDDEIKNLVNCNAQQKICFGNYEWNQDWDGIRILSWKDLVNFIVELNKKEVENDDKGEN